MKKFVITFLAVITSIYPLYSQFQNFLIEEKNLSPVSYQLDYENQIFSKSLFAKIMLWLSGDNVQSDENLMISQWSDISSNKLIAFQTKPTRMPKFLKEGINGFPSVSFEGNTNFGDEDIITVNYHPAITTDLEFEDNTKKTLSVVFYCEDLSRKQVIFEAGGAISGFNIYIEPPDNLYFGIYKEWKRIFLKLQITPGLHLAQLEFDGSKFRGVLDGKASDYKSFAGIINDVSGTGIGGASTGARFHNFSTGVTYGHHFSGLISEIIMMNDCNSASSSKVIYDYMDKKYNIYGSYPYNWNKSSEADENELIQSENQVFQIINNNFEKTVNLIIDEDDFCKIETFDMNGRLIEKIYNGEIKANFEYNFNLNQSLYSTGAYFARLKGDRNLISKYFSIIK
ncbi:MAG: hypothetical protein N2319_08465 [Candidatus Kapabacteria bacterium]|nr:hypothetical protein [Candidatus Kapabacteria bacterium]